METEEGMPVFQGESKTKDNKEISLPALKGLANSKIIKVEGHIPDCKLMVIIDSGFG